MISINKVRLRVRSRRGSASLRNDFGPAIEPAIDFPSQALTAAIHGSYRDDSFEAIAFVGNVMDKHAGSC